MHWTAVLNSVGMTVPLQKQDFLDLIIAQEILHTFLMLQILTKYFLEHQEVLHFSMLPLVVTPQLNCRWAVLVIAQQLYKVISDIILIVVSLKDTMEVIGVDWVALSTLIKRLTSAQKIPAVVIMMNSNSIPLVISH